MNNLELIKECYHCYKNKGKGKKYLDFCHDEI